MMIKNATSVQQWFASVLRQPITQNSRLQDSELVDEVEKFITPSPTLNSRQRIEIYAQQYWWRLYKVLQEQFPLVLRLFGYTDFNEQLGKPFLLKHEPRHWNINFLGEGFVEWLQDNYVGDDKALIVACAQIDWAWVKAFLAPNDPLPTNIFETLYLANSTYIFKLKWSLFEFRKILIEHPVQYWIENEFPPLKKEKDYFFVLRRSPKGNIKVDPLDEWQFMLLQEFVNGLSLNTLCNNLQLQELPEDYKAILLKQSLLTPIRLTNENYPSQPIQPI